MVAVTVPSALVVIVDPSSKVCVVEPALVAAGAVSVAPELVASWKLACLIRCQPVTWVGRVAGYLFVAIAVALGIGVNIRRDVSWIRIFFKVSAYIK